MKSALIGVGAALVVAVLALIWQVRTIAELRAETAALRRDLRISLRTMLEDAAPPASAEEQAQREKLELIKLRHEVRELRENMAASHASKPGGVRELLNPLWSSAAAAGGALKFRAEWAGMESSASNGYVRAIQDLNKCTNEYARYLVLPNAARMSLAVGRTADAHQFATDLMVLNDKYAARGQLNGDGVHHANVVLGRLALEEGQVDDAKRHLLAAGKTAGSPVLCSFGPNMSLAKELLEKREVETVLQYFELCRKFWSSNFGKLDQWTKEIQAGRVPEFGASLIH